MSVVEYRPLRIADTVNTKKSYGAWIGTLSADEFRQLRRCETLIAAQLEYPFGRVQWRAFVIAVVNLYEDRQAADEASRRQVVEMHKASAVSPAERGVLIDMCAGRDVSTVSRDVWTSLLMRDFVVVAWGVHRLTDAGRMAGELMLAEQVSAAESNEQILREYNIICAQRMAQTEASYWGDLGSKFVSPLSVGFTIMVAHLMRGWEISDDQAKLAIGKLPEFGWSADEAVKAVVAFAAMDNVWAVTA